VGIQVIRRAAFVAAPWRNGGGVTHEVMRVPAGGPFRWRVSMAQIDASGPFSDFAGYDRTMVLLRGAGVALTFGDGTAGELRQVGDLVKFDGAVATECRLLGGPCVDLNVMVAKTLPATARVERLEASLSMQALRHQTLLIFSIDEPVELQPAGDPRPQALQLGPWELAVVTDCSATLRRTGAGAHTPVFLATLNDRL
jgi:environmental stress-induced protein Ves